MTDACGDVSAYGWKCFSDYTFHRHYSWKGNWQLPRSLSLMSQKFSHSLRTSAYLRNPPEFSLSTQKFIFIWLLGSRVDRPSSKNPNYAHLPEYLSKRNAFEKWKNSHVWFCYVFDLLYSYCFNLRVFS